MTSKHSRAGSKHLSQLRLLNLLCLKSFIFIPEGLVMVTRRLRQLITSVPVPLTATLLVALSTAAKVQLLKRNLLNWFHHHLRNTIFNEQTMRGSKVDSFICTPKQPKVICLDDYFSNKFSSTQDSISSSSSIHQASTASSTSFLYGDNALLKMISTVTSYPIKIWYCIPTKTPPIKYSLIL